MSVSAVFIKRPIMTILVYIAFVIIGLQSFFLMPLSDLPNVDYPVILVSVSYPGANPETMANSVATPLEREFMTIPGIENITSSSHLGSTQIIIQFDISKGINEAAQEVQAAISRAQPTLPPDLPNPPVYKKVNPAIAPILYLVLTSDTIPLDELYTYANTYIGQNLSLISGVAQVQIFGSPHAVRVQVNPDILANIGVTLPEIRKTLIDANPKLAVGQLDGLMRASTVVSKNQYERAEPYNPLIIAYRDGAPIRIQDVGKAINSFSDDRYNLRYVNAEQNHAAIGLAILRQGGANVVEVADLVFGLLPKLKAKLPEGLDIRVVYDKSQSVRSTVHEVEKTLLIAFILVVAIIYLSVGKVLDTLIPSIVLPISVIGTFVFMYPLGYSIDTLSLLALILAIGFIVDDAIVVLENIVRRTETGENPYLASLHGSQQIGFTIWSITLSLIAVFIPLLFMGGLVGKILREFSVTLTIITLLSGVISLTLTPMLCSLMIKREHNNPTFMERFALKMNNALIGLYKPMLLWMVEHRWVALVISLASFILTVFLFMLLPKALIPDDDIGFIQVNTLAQEGISSAQMNIYQNEIIEIFRKSPYVNDFVSLVSSPQYENGAIYMFLKPVDERPPIMDVIAELKKQTSQVVGINTYYRSVPLIDFTLGASSSGAYQYVLQSLDGDALYEAAEKFKNTVSAWTGFEDVNSDLRIRTPEINIKILRDRASSLGINAFDIELALGLAYSGGRVTRISTPTEFVDVILELERRFQRKASLLSTIYLKSGISGDLVPLNAVAEWNEIIGPASVNHISGFPSVTISFNLAKDLPVIDAIAKLDALAKETLPPAVNGAVKGAAETTKKSAAQMPLLLLASIGAIYLILGVLYESFIHPITILSTLPPAALGAMLTLYIFGMPLSLYSFLGIILLLGIVKKNGIMMVDFALDYQRNEKRTPKEAIIEGCIARFRPITMTTLSAVMGAVPIALETGVGAVNRQPLGYVIIGGLLFSQLLTLLVTPVIYLYLDKWSQKFSFSKIDEDKGVHQHS